MKRFRCLRSLIGASLVLLVLCASGCAGSLYGWQVRTNSTPMSSSFDPVKLEKQTIALFGSVTTPVLQGTEVGLSHILRQIIQQMAPSLRVLSSQEFAERINRKGLVGEYARMRGDYWQSDILDGASLRTIATGIGVRYVFQPRLSSFSQTMTDRWTVPAVDVRASQTRSSIMRASLQLWDAETGEMLWNSYAEATMENEAFSQDPVYFEDIARVTFASMISDFMNKKTGSTYSPVNKLLDGLIKRKETQQEQAPHQ
jgi:hypothetical protein